MIAKALKYHFVIKVTEQFQQNSDFSTIVERLYNQANIL